MTVGEARMQRRERNSRRGGATAKCSRGCAIFSRVYSDGLLRILQMENWIQLLLGQSYPFSTPKKTVRATPPSWFRPRAWFCRQNHCPRADRWAPLLPLSLSPLDYPQRLLDPTNPPHASAPPWRLRRRLRGPRCCWLRRRAHRRGALARGKRRQGGSPRPCSARRRRRALPTSAHPRGCREGDRELGPAPPRRIRSSPALGRPRRPRRAGSAPPRAGPTGGGREGLGRGSSGEPRRSSRRAGERERGGWGGCGEEKREDAPDVRASPGM
jgi:hypothetical protein